MTVDWQASMEDCANTLRGKRLSVAFERVLERLLQHHDAWLDAEDTPQAIDAALTQLLASGRWRAQPKHQKSWKRGWRGLRVPDKLICQPQRSEPETVYWHPWLAEKGAATRVWGKHREKLKRLNQHLIRCDALNEDPFPGDILGQRERALRLFDDEKALDSMPDSGWKSVPLTREELRCVKKTPPLQCEYQPLGQQPPFILENVETFHRFVAINQATPTWRAVIWGSGAQVSSQGDEIARLVIESGFQQVLYFGDLDAKGLEIVTTLRSQLQQHRIDVELAESFYRLIIESDLTTHEGGANLAGTFDTRWMPAMIVNNLHRLMAVNQRIPQEAFIGAFAEYD